MKPLNRRLLIEVVEEKPEEGAFYVPVEETPQEFLTAKVLDCAEDCTKDFTGQTVVVHAFGTEEVRIKGRTLVFIGESNLICAE